MHEIGERVVLPAPRRVGINAGVGTLPDVAVSPDGPEPAWAYRVIAKDAVSGKGFSWLVGMPAGSGPVAFKALPRFTTAIPPGTTAEQMQDWVARVEEAFDYIVSDQAVVDAVVAAVDANPKIATLEQKNVTQDAAITARIPHRQVAGNINLDTLTTTEDVMLTSTTGVTNAPDTSLFLVQIRATGAGVTQNAISMIRKDGPSWRRVYSAGSWGAWMLTSLRGVTPASSVDFNTFTTVGTVSIQSTSHLNQPVAKVGALETIPATGFVVQRFTTWESVPEVHMRRQTAATTWSAWAKNPTRTEFDQLTGRVLALETAAPAPPVQAFSTPTRAALTASPVTVTSKSASGILMTLSKDRLRGWNCNTASLSETRDDGETWTQLLDKTGANPFSGSTVESVRQMDNGELLISCGRGAGTANRRELWVTTNLNDPTLRTFTKTLTARAPFIKFTSAWSQSDSGPMVMVNEYGPKTPTWTGEAVAEGENARYTYLSVDYGKTWATVFDLNTYLTGQGRVSMDNQHLHGASIDPYWDRLWVTFGDNMGGNGSNGIVYSDDLGATWETAHYYTGTTPPHQCVGILPMPKCVLFFTDNVSPGFPDVVRIDRTEGRYKAGGYTTVPAWESTAGGKHLCQGFSRIMRRGDDAPALAAFSSEGVAAPSFAIATMDGYTFTEIWRDTEDNPSGFGSRSIMGPTARGQVIIASNDQKVGGMWSEIKAEAPGY